MKITFSNLGAIKKTTLDLRPLTVIIGPNNSNKTYIAYSIYGLLSELVNTSSGSYLKSLGFDHSYSENVKELYEFKDEIYSLKINNEFFQIFDEECLGQVREFEKRMEIFFQDSSKKIFKRTNFKVEYTKSEIKANLEKLIVEMKRNFSDSFRYSIEKNILRVASNSIFSEKDFFPRQISLILGFDLKKLLFREPFVLPAERNALIITYKILENRRYDLLKNVNRELFVNNNSRRENSPKFFGGEISPSQQGINYPRPIEDFLDFLTDLGVETNLETQGEFAKFADNIEKNLQQNNKTNFIPAEFGGGEIKISIKKGLNIDLHNASSSIKQLAPLLLYLRYRAKRNDLLIIDEPEMNLHPESQAKLLEVLGMLVNAGVNVLLTTHSPYFMSHLNNLIAGDMDDEKIREKQAKSLYLEDARAFLKPEDVSAYEMRQNKKGEQTLHDLHDKDYGIRWDTLSDVSADIQQKFFEIYEQKEESSNGEEKEG
ncbi:AAA family ATPase [soil metagenome]